MNKKLRSHFLKNHRENKSFDMMIYHRCYRNLPPKPLEKAKITIVRHTYSRMMDYDGLVGSMKPVVDALVTVGVLKDDSWSVTGPWHVSQCFRKKKDGPLLEIMVQEID